MYIAIKITSNSARSLYIVVEAAYLMGESFSTPLPSAYIRPVTFMEGFDVHSQIKRLKESNSNG